MYIHYSYVIYIKFGLDVDFFNLGFKKMFVF